MVSATSYGKAEWLGVNIVLAQPAADVDHGAAFGAGAAFWRLAQMRGNTGLGCNCIMGRGAYVGHAAGEGMVGESAEQDMSRT
jgi:hypothetical protein